MRVIAVDSRVVRWEIEGRGAARGRSERSAVIVEMRDERGTRALGEAAPLPGMSRDSVDDVQAAVAALRVPFDVDTVAAALAIAESASPAASFAIATAVLGLMAQRRGVAIGELVADAAVAAVADAAIATATATAAAAATATAAAAAAAAATATATATIALAAVVDSIDEAYAAVARGIRCLKVKLGADDDLARVAAIAALPGVRLRLDANRAWPIAEVAERLAVFAGLPIDFIEEPCRDAHRLLHERLAVPIALDESLGELTDDQLAAALRSQGLAALVLKPTLLGLPRTLALAARARASGVAVVVTHALEGPIGTAMCAEVARAIGTAAAGVAPHAALAGFAVAVPQLAGATVRAAGPGLGFGDLALATLCDPLTITADDRPAILGAAALTFAQCVARLPEPHTADPCESVVATPTVDTLLAIYAALTTRRPIALHHHRLAAGELARREAMLAGTRLPPDAAVVLFTSGSTGLARGVALSRAALVAAAQTHAAHLGWRADDRWLLALSLAHAGGLAISIRCLAARRPLVLLEDDFDPRRVATLLADGVTLASLVPTQLHALLDDPHWHPPAQLRAVLLGGAPATPELLARAHARGVCVLVTYGMTESIGQVATAPPSRAGDPDAPLYPLPGVTLLAGTPDAPAPIRVRAPMLATRYLDGTPIAPELTTSDLGYLAEGALHIVGRADDMIITGGENVHPVHIEAVLAATPGVRAACVFGVADARWGQIVGAALAVDSDFDAGAAIARWGASLAPHARPRRLAVAAALPLLPTGKLDRHAAAALSATAVEYR